MMADDDDDDLNLENSRHNFLLIKVRDHFTTYIFWRFFSRINFINETRVLLQLFIF